MTIRSYKAFNAALETLKQGNVGGLGESDHETILKALRRFRDRQSGRFSELTAYINEAEEIGYAARTQGRRQIAESLTPGTRKADPLTAAYQRELALGRA